MKIKIEKIGNRSGIILPKKLMKKYDLKEGDVLTVKKEGSALALRPVSNFSEWAEAYRNANIEYKDVLKELSND